MVMTSKKRGLLQRLFGSKKTSFDSISTDESDVVALQALQSSSSSLFARRHTIDVETFQGEVSDQALMAAASEKETSDVSYRGTWRRLYSRVKSRGSPLVTPRRQRHSAVLTTKPTTKSATKPALKPTSDTSFGDTTTTEDSADADDDRMKKKASYRRRRIGRRDRLRRYGTLCKVDTSQPIVYPTTPETILEYHKAMPFLDQNEEWLMVELNEYECLVDGIEIIKIIANHSKFFEVEPDELWEEFFQFVDDVPAYDEVINFDVWQEFRDKKYTC